jgi:hypothetical protein
MGVISTNGKGFSIYSSSNYGSIRFYTNTGYNGIIERMRINAEGNTGIGTREPVAKLQIADGDVYISDIGRGIIMKSPDGNCWRGQLDNYGRLVFHRINCPETEIAGKIDPIITPVSVSVFPNPAGNIVSVRIESGQIEKAKYAIYNLSGQLQDDGRIRANVEIDISAVSGFTS